MFNSTAFRYDEQINDHTYRILVSQVRSGTWRAQVVTPHGGPTAVMPFYGDSPEQAREQLASWIARAHRSARAAAS